MSLGKNIYDAFEIVEKTYENVYELMRYCQEEATQKGDFIASSPKFLRYKSDNKIDGWSIKSFILVFQNSNDLLLENKWRDGPLFVMEINLFSNKYDVPMVNITKFEYKTDLSS